MRKQELTAALVAGVTEFAAVTGHGSMRQNASASDYSRSDVARIRIVKVHDTEPREAYSRYGEQKKIVEYEAVEEFDYTGEPREVPENRQRGFIAIRRVLLSWEDYLVALDEAAQTRERHARARAERLASFRAHKARFDAKVAALDLKTQPKYGKPEPLFLYSIDENRADANLYLRGNRPDVERLLDRLIAAEARVAALDEQSTCSVWSDDDK